MKIEKVFTIPGGEERRSPGRTHELSKAKNISYEFVGSGLSKFMHQHSCMGMVFSNM